LSNSGYFEISEKKVHKILNARKIQLQVYDILIATIHGLKSLQYYKGIK